MREIIKKLKIFLPRNYFREKYIDKFINDLKFAQKIFSLYFSKEDLLKNKKIHILDFGCSLGRIGAILSNLGFENIDCYNIREYETWPRIKRKFKNLNFYSNPEKIKNKKYDVIIMIVVIEYIKDYLEAFKTISDLLVKNGLFFGFFVNKESFWHKITRKKTGTVIYQEFNLAELKNIFHEIGLSISKIKYEGFRIPFINRVMSLLLPSANTLSYFSNFWNFIIPEKLREYIVIYATKKSN